LDVFRFGFISYLFFCCALIFVFDFVLLLCTSFTVNFSYFLYYGYNLLYIIIFLILLLLLFVVVAVAFIVAVVVGWLLFVVVAVVVVDVVYLLL